MTPHKLSAPLQELTKPCHNMQGLKISLQRVKHDAGGALTFLYNSTTYELISECVADMLVTTMHN